MMKKLKKFTKKIIKKITNDRFQYSLLLWFLILQPFLDCHLLYSEKVIALFGFSPTTIIRLVFIACLALLVFLCDKSKKNKIILISYGILIAIYTVIHHICCSGLTINNYPSFLYSTATEFLYMLRMLLPVGVMYLGYQIKYKKEDFIRLICNTTAIMSIIIILLNLTKTSSASYGGGLIEGNILDWFFSIGRYGPESLASKGWFNSANQISGLYMLLLPFVIYDLFDKFELKKLLNIVVAVISMTMIGTRVATYGWILVVAMIIIIDIYMMLIHKHKFRKSSYISTLLVIIFGLFLGHYAPIVSSEMVDVYNASDDAASATIEEIAVLSEQIVNDELSNKEKKEVLKKNKCLKSNGEMKIECLVNKLSISPTFYNEIYPVKDHADFWKYFMFDVPAHKKYGQRKIQYLISQDVYKEQKQSLTPVLGLGYSRFTNAYLYPEHDYYVHYLTIGIIGILLLVVIYPMLAIVSLIYMLIKRKFNFLNIILCAAILETTLISMLTGHIMDELIVSLFIGFISGFLLKRMKEINNEKTNY